MNNLGTLYRYELKKILHRKIVWLSLAVCLIITGTTMTADLLGSYYVNNEKTDTNYNMFLVDREYQRALDGREIDLSLLEEMSNAYGMIPPTTGYYTFTEEYQKYARPYSPIFNFVRGTTNMTTSETMQWTPDEDDLYARRQNMLESSWQSENLTEGEKEFWRQKETELQTPFVYKYTENHFMLLRALQMIGLLVLLSVSVCLAGVFAEEHTRKTDQLILCSKHGKALAYWAKILAGISYAMGVSLIISTFAFILTFGVYGTDGFTAMFQLVFEECSYPITAGEAVLILYGCLLVTALISGIFVMLLSELLHSSIAALSAASGMLILSEICTIPPQYRILAQIWDWLPSGFLTPWHIFDLRLLPVFGHYFTAWQAAPVIYLLTGIIAAAAGKLVYQRYQVSGR